jgi:hypothetical protein
MIIRVLSNDGLEVVIDLTVLCTVFLQMLNNFQRNWLNYIDKIVRPVTRTRIRDNAVFYDAVALYSTKGMSSRRNIKSIAADFKTRGLVLEQLIRNILSSNFCEKDN